MGQRRSVRLWRLLGRADHGHPGLLVQELPSQRLFLEKLLMKPGANVMQSGITSPDAFGGPLDSVADRPRDFFHFVRRFSRNVALPSNRRPWLPRTFSIHLAQGVLPWRCDHSSRG